MRVGFKGLVVSCRFVAGGRFRLLSLIGRNRGVFNLGQFLNGREKVRDWVTIMLPGWKRARCDPLSARLSGLTRLQKRTGTWSHQATPEK